MITVNDVFSKSYVFPVKNNNFLTESDYINKNSYILKNSSKDYFSRNTPKSKISFQAAPKILDLAELGIPYFGEITAKQAIDIFKKFRIGNYLDIGDDLIFPENKLIREDNLNFLNRVTSQTEKLEFIDYYKKLTGFPDLAKVSQNIKNQFVYAVKKADEKIKEYGVSNKVIYTGYDGVCSVGRGKALPGSDIDKAFVIIDTKNPDQQSILNEFKGALWYNTDQRILSYNHDLSSFPQIYTRSRAEELFSAIDKKAKMIFKDIEFANPFDDIILKWCTNFMLKTAIKKDFKDVMETFHENYVEANQFFINVCKRFPPKIPFYEDSKFITREDIKNFGFIMEAMREGIYFSLFGSFPFKSHFNDIAFKYNNLSQLKALKSRSDMKPKRLARVALKNDFDKWDVDKRFRFITAMIHASCANSDGYSDEFAIYFKSKEDKRFALLNKALTVNERGSR